MRTNFKILIPILFLLFSHKGILLFSSQEEDKDVITILSDDFESAFDDLGFIANDLVDFDSYSAIKLGGVIVGTAALIPADMPVYNYIENNKVKHSDTEKFLEVLDNFGTIPVADGLAVGIYLTGLIAQDESIRTTGRLLVETLILSGFTTITSRIIIGRSRPYNLKGNGTFRPFTLDYFYHSFPSGHITISFAMATLLSNRIDTWWAYTGLYGLATLNTVSRLYFSAHWASDTFISASIGALSALAVIKAYEHSIGKKESSSDTGLDFGISPLGLQLQYRF
ncbi:MAG: phosphatase PAP2 family protein [Chlorobiota bacterium]